MPQKHWMFYLFLFLLGISINQTHASVISSSNTNIKVTQGTSGEIVTLAPVNASGISYNAFSEFNLSGSPLKLLNTPSFDSNGDRIPAASLIIIKASNINLAGSIELLGPMSSVLFISDSTSGKVTCNACELSNFSRITLAVAKASETFAATMANVGILNSGSASSGEIEIRSLYAPGANHLELIAKNLDITGDIDTNIQVDQNNTPNINGGRTLGAGAVDAYIGRVAWNFDQQSVVDIDPDTVTHNLNFDVNAVSIKFTTSGLLNINGTMNTKVDVLSISVYNGLNRLPTESITFQAFAESGTSTLGGNLITNGSVYNRFNHHLTLKNNASKISSDYQEYAVTGNLYVQRNLFAHNIRIAANNIINQSKIEVGSQLIAYADNNLVNHFGGRLIGDVLTLESKQGFVRNGSRTPYIKDVTQESLLNYYTSDLVLTEQETDKLGTFYHRDNLVDVTGQYTQPSDTSAHISARKLTVKSSAFENINPYWENVDETGETIFKPEYITQVSVIAQDELRISTRDGQSAKPGYVLNSSAILHIPKNSSVLRIDTDYVINQRYRNLTLLDYITDESIYNNEYAYSIIRKVSSRAYTYSPPGLFLSMGAININAEVGFVNETAFFEVYGTAKFYGLGIYDWGIEHDGIIKAEGTFPEWQICSLVTGESFMLMDEQGNYYPNPDCEDIGTTTTDTRTAPSLFLINGQVATGPNFHSSTLNTWEGYTQKAIDTAITQYNPNWWEGPESDIHNYGMLNICYGCPTPPPPEEAFYDQHITYEASLQNISGDDVLLYYEKHFLNTTSQHSWDMSSGVFEIIVDETKEIKVISEFTQQEKTVSLSLTDLMIKLYNSLVDMISDLISEFKWWGE